MDHRDDAAGRERPPAEAAAAPSKARWAGGAWRSSRARAIAAELRCKAQVTAASQAEEIRLVAGLVAEVEAVVRAELAEFGPRVPGQPHDEDVVEDAVMGELQGTLGIGAWWAAKLIEAATRLTTVHHRHVGCGRGGPARPGPGPAAGNRDGGAA